MSEFIPIVRNLECEDEQGREHHLLQVDVTPHVISAFPSTELAVKAMNDEDFFIEEMRVAFEEDPSLLDDNEEHLSWTLYEGDVRGMLLGSLGIAEDDGSMTDEALWETWIEAATSDGTADRHRSGILDALGSRIDALERDFQDKLGESTLVAIACAVLSRQGGTDAVRRAIEDYKGSDVVGLMKLAGALPNQK
jgi:hypothetical protein